MKKEDKIQSVADLLKGGSLDLFNDLLDEMETYDSVNQLKDGDTPQYSDAKKRKFYGVLNRETDNHINDLRLLVRSFFSWDRSIKGRRYYENLSDYIYNHMRAKTPLKDFQAALYTELNSDYLTGLDKSLIKNSKK